jgi:hypothetical protein
MSRALLLLTPLFRRVVVALAIAAVMLALADLWAGAVNSRSVAAPAPTPDSAVAEPPILFQCPAPSKHPPPNRDARARSL